MQLPDDPFIRELLPEFVETWITDIDAQFGALIESKNWDDLYRFGHTLKGSCFQFGLDNIAAQGIELMGYAKEKDLENAGKMGDILKNSFIDIKKELDNNPDYK
ncbi:MAG: Hpt domain-containing protein [Ignavibacteriae bacterium]|nr:Hpt domain-containing protein [Ignavibacteriota bacterium]